MSKTFVNACIAKTFFVFDLRFKPNMDVFISLFLLVARKYTTKYQV